MAETTKAELEAQLTRQDQELAELRAERDRRAEQDQDQAAAEQAAKEGPPPAPVPAVGTVQRDDRYSDGYVLVVAVDDDAVTFARLGELHQVARHVLKGGKPAEGK